MIKGILFDVDDTLIYHPDNYIEKVVAEALLVLNLEGPKDFAHKFWHGGDREKIIIDELNISPMSFWKVFRKYDIP